MRTTVKLGAATGPEALGEIPEGGAVGFQVGIPASPYSLEPSAIPPLIERLPNGVEAWAVVVDPSAELIHRLYDEVGVDRIQVYGVIPEGLEFLEMHHLVPSLPVPTSGTPGDAPPVPAAEDYPRLHLDTVGRPYVAGSAERPEWEICARLVDLHPGRKFTLAGGLSPENVASALATVRPWGVEVTHGVERVPGAVDRERLRAFLRSIEQFERAGSPAP
jgi:phosphoribosylanthranilate isomerase